MSDGLSARSTLVGQVSDKRETGGQAPDKCRISVGNGQTVERDTLVVTHLSAGWTGSAAGTTRTTGPTSPAAWPSAVRYHPLETLYKSKVPAYIENFYVIRRSTSATAVCHCRLPPSAPLCPLRWFSNTSGWTSRATFLAACVRPPASVFVQKAGPLSVVKGKTMFSRATEKRSRLF